MDLHRRSWAQTTQTLLFLPSVTITGLLIPLSLQAQETGPEGTDAEAGTAETIFSLVMKGGPLMYPIFLCSLIVLTIAIERLISLRRRRIGDVELLDAITELIPSRQEARGDAVTQATKMCEEDETLVGGLLRVGVERLRHDGKNVTAVLDETIQKEKHRLDRRLRPFAIVATLAPLLGLLGTVLGLILCFGDASTAMATERAQKLSDGIYRALVTTAAGLTVAIPAMVLDYYFQGRMDRVLDVVDDVTTRFLDFYYATPSSTAEPTVAAVTVSETAESDDKPSKEVRGSGTQRRASSRSAGTRTRLSS